MMERFIQADGQRWAHIGNCNYLIRGRYFLEHPQNDNIPGSLLEKLYKILNECGDIVIETNELLRKVYHAKYVIASNHNKPRN